ncbi:hypothetical protein GCM10010278_79760 [Streptomyces melanogenes]|nr:hypothetical protein GCM10010278_79760 [Streptomyces melanogenes]
MSPTDPLSLLSSPEVAPAVLPAADTVMQAAQGGGLTKGSAFDKEQSGGVSGVYLDGLDSTERTRNGGMEPSIPIENPVGQGDFQVHPLNGASAAGGLASVLG